jgi:lipopolysaccharide transport system ATP-binding protein
LTVKRGDAIGILGSNGAGKSTLLKIISGITAPGSGQLCAARQGAVGVGGGHRDFIPDLNARDNVLLNGALLGMKRSEILAASRRDHCV